MCLDGLCLCHAAVDDNPDVVTQESGVVGAFGVGQGRREHPQVHEHGDIGDSLLGERPRQRGHVGSCQESTELGVGRGSNAGCRRTLSSVRCRESASDAKYLVCFRLGPSFDSFETALGTWPKLFLRSRDFEFRGNAEEEGISSGFSIGTAWKLGVKGDQSCMKIYFQGDACVVHLVFVP